jgi:hypothetical protein
MICLVGEGGDFAEIDLGELDLGELDLGELGGDGVDQEGAFAGEAEVGFGFFD